MTAVYLIGAHGLFRVVARLLTWGPEAWGRKAADTMAEELR